MHPEGKRLYFDSIDEALSMEKVRIDTTENTWDLIPDITCSDCGNGKALLKPVSESDFAPQSERANLIELYTDPGCDNGCPIRTEDDEYVNWKAHYKDLFITVRELEDIVKNKMSGWWVYFDSKLFTSTRRRNEEVSRRS